MVTACVPTLPLQMVFAHQAAPALALHRERQLAGMARLTAFWLTRVRRAALGTGALTMCGMLALWLAGPWGMAFVYKSGDVTGVMRLLPWYAGR